MTGTARVRFFFGAIGAVTIRRSRVGACPRGGIAATITHSRGRLHAGRSGLTLAMLFFTRRR
jgi:hypothetical protein